jgi:hypothetical protein
LKLQTLTLSLAMLVISGLQSCTAMAAEFYDKAEVVRYEPITRIDHARRVIPGCITNKPNNNQLMAVLRWDLSMSHCIETVADEKITGYRVFYEWDEQLFSQVTHEIPGQTIPVHIKVD